MGKFGFENDDEEVFDQALLNTNGLRKPKKPAVKESTKKAILNAGKAMGYNNREIRHEAKKLNRKPGRKPPTEPRGQLLIGGPQDIINEFKQWCINNGNMPYWEGLKELISISKK